MKAKVYISYKEGILDPQGKTVGNALQTMDLKGISDIRIGKYIEIISTLPEIYVIKVI